MCCICQLCPYEVPLLGRVLRLPSVDEVDAKLASTCPRKRLQRLYNSVGSERFQVVQSCQDLRCQPLVADVGLEQALELVKSAGSSSCTEVATWL